MPECMDEQERASNGNLCRDLPPEVAQAMGILVVRDELSGPPTPPVF